MKNRLKSIILACVLAAGMLSCVSFAAGVQTDEAETAAEAVESVSAADEKATEEATEAAAAVVADDTAAAAQDGGANAQLYEPLKNTVVGVLGTLSAMSEEEVQDVIDKSTIESEVRMAANWQSVAEELGNFTGIGEQTVEEDGNSITVLTEAFYDGTPEGTDVEVSYVYNVNTKAATMSWGIDYPKSKLFKEAGLNTLLGLGIVFVTLIFLSFLISQLHWIPDLIANKDKKKESGAATETAPAPAPAPAEEETGDLTDDLELVAVIAAAVAACEEAPTDGFVVRSIRRINRSKQPNA